MITGVEEFDIITKFHFPHLFIRGTDFISKKIISNNVFLKNNEEVLLIVSEEFLYDSVFSGLSEKHIEYIAKNAPQDYKNNILKILKDQQMMKGVFEITQSMDANNTMEHQKRIKNVIQYIKDNYAVFEF